MVLFDGGGQQNVCNSLWLIVCLEWFNLQLRKDTPLVGSEEEDPVTGKNWM